MTKVLLIGQVPETVDFSNPALPPGMTAEIIQAGIASTLADMRGRGWTAVSCTVRPDETAVPQVVAELQKADYDVVVIGGGIRIPPPALLMFEAILNAVHAHAPKARIAFNTRPENSADAAARWL